jgi:serine/threonine-protein kinase
MDPEQTRSNGAARVGPEPGPLGNGFRGLDAPAAGQDRTAGTGAAPAEISSIQVDPAAVTGGSGPAASVAVTESGPRPAAQPLPPGLFDLLKGWDRYSLVGLLGQGGMGQVYKAVDTRLGRLVALKFLRGEDPELARRMLEEARAQARIEHPNVCKVYEAGEVQGRAYIAMQLIQGKPLSRAAAELSLEEKLLVVRQAAEGLHAAHRLGIVHRDIKPSNIVVERREDGRLIPYVMDFGLARTAGDPGATTTGAVVGTPAFMSPEQALGRVRRLDRRTDVYSLGATLYAVLTGTQPFQGDSSLEILRNVIEAEPPLLRQRDPAIPREVESIVLKCLEKAPSQRYNSALALAEDLGRFLDGLPVRARSSTWVYRLGKRASRHKTLAAVVSAALVLVLAFAAVGLHARWQAGRLAELAQEFGQDVKEIELVMRFASFLQPLHDVGRERKRVEQAMERIRQKMDGLGSIALGPGNHALGRGYLALDDYENARMCLAKKWMLGQHSADLADALGQALAGLYLDGLRQLRFVGNPEIRARRAAQLGQDHRLPALEFLRRGLEGGHDSDGYSEALADLLEGRYEDAVRRATEAAEKVPWFYEARSLAGDALALRGSEALARGRLDEAEADLERSRQAYRKASEIARSYPDAYVGLCSASVELIEVAGRGSRPVGRFHAEAVEACQRALRADPHLAFASLLLTEAHRRLDEARSGPGAAASGP